MDGRGFREWRSTTGVTVGDLARRLRCSPMRVHRVEDGSIPARPGELTEWCEVVHVLRMDGRHGS